MQEATQSALARGLLRLAVAGSLEEGALLRACERHPPGLLREALEELRGQRLLERQGTARWVVAEHAAQALLGWIATRLAPRSRISGETVRGLLQMFPGVVAQSDLEARIMGAVQRLGRGVYGGMVSLPELGRDLGLAPAQLEEPLRRLARAARLQLEPLSDPLSIPQAERALGIPDPVRGLLFYVSPARVRRGARTRSGGRGR